MGNKSTTLTSAKTDRSFFGGAAGAEGVEGQDGRWFSGELLFGLRKHNTITFHLRQLVSLRQDQLAG